jgi:alpha-mannosidase
VVQELNAAEPAQGEILWISHAHLDLAWLWPVADTWQSGRTNISLGPRFDEALA